MLPNPFQGLKLIGMDKSAIRSALVTMLPNPFQGLKRVILRLMGKEIEVTMLPNPFQGLKPR